MKLHPETKQQAQMLGLSHEKVLEMAEDSAPFTDDRGDWRYEGYVLDHRDGIVYGIWEKDNPDSPVVLKHRQCLTCAGEGCSTCNDTGEVYCDISSYIDMRADAEE